ncbi:MAG TPA: hypothetical protein VGO00_25400, partial [Kofleriaceae bacterium]|nr:hypothetical protein [Kofleriaceae bacterium]
VAGVRAAYVDTIMALRRRAVATADVSARVRLTKSPADYTAARDDRRELAYEALIAAGRTTWTAGEHVRVYRARAGRAGLVDDAADPRDYDIDHYVRVLRDTFASRLARAFAPADFSALLDDPEQQSLFAPAYGSMRTILTTISTAGTDPVESPSSA